MMTVIVTNCFPSFLSFIVFLLKCSELFLLLPPSFPSQLPDTHLKWLSLNMPSHLCWLWRALPGALCPSILSTTLTGRHYYNPILQKVKTGWWQGARTHTRACQRQDLFFFSSISVRPCFKVDWCLRQGWGQISSRHQQGRKVTNSKVVLTQSPREERGPESAVPTSSAEISMVVLTCKHVGISVFWRASRSRFPSPTPGVSISLGLGWSPRI